MNFRYRQTSNWLFLFFLLIASFYGFSQDQAVKRNLLSGNLNPDKIKAIFVKPGQWHPFQALSDRSVWLNVPESIKEAYVKEALKHLHDTIEPLPATVFLEFARNGNRSCYEAISFSRRKNLANLVIAEAFEEDGRYMDAILNYIWAICEESFWGVPAHLSPQKTGYGLPDVDQPVVELFGAETGGTLALTSYLLKDKLDKISPLIVQRISKEISRRLLNPYMDRNFEFMGFDSNKIVNNWDPWINSNMLLATLLTEKDQDKQSKQLYKILLSLDNFLNSYPADGSCDEGPGYWEKAGGAMFDCLEILNSATERKIDLSRNALIKNMGNFVYKAHISQNYFVNTGDALPAISPAAALIYRYGKYTGNDTLKSFALASANLNSTTGSIRSGSLRDMLAELFTLNEIQGKEGHFPMLRDVWLPGVQLFCARDFEGSDKGYFFSLKGAHNGESHNHNDVGTFSVYYDGKPVLIDAGPETYTAKTFSAQRYELWNMQSGYHNVPTINSVMQGAGKEFRAQNLNYNITDTNAEMDMDISKAYPDSAHVISWKRTVQLNRGKNIAVTDAYRLSQALHPVVFNLITSLKYDFTDSGQIRLMLSGDKGKSQGKVISLHYDTSKYKPTAERIPLIGSRLQKFWGNQIYRIQLTAVKNQIQDSSTITITAN